MIWEKKFYVWRWFGSFSGQKTEYIHCLNYKMEYMSGWINHGLPTSKTQ